jgi:hypothetical protein
MDAVQYLSTKEARLQGRRRFLTDKPCRRGHVGERRLKQRGSECVECSRIEARKRMRVGRERNPEPYRERDRRRYAANPNRRKKKNLARYAAHENMRRARKLQQTCTCCTPEQFKELYAVAHALGCHVDHKEPLALGGLHCLRNLQLLTSEQHLAKTAIDISNITKARRKAGATNAEFA